MSKSNNPKNKKGFSFFLAQVPCKPISEKEIKNKQIIAGIFYRLFILLMIFGYYKLVLFEIDYDNLFFPSEIIKDFGVEYTAKDFFYHSFNWDGQFFSSVRTFYLMFIIYFFGSYLRYLQADNFDLIGSFLRKPLRKIKIVELSYNSSFIINAIRVGMLLAALVFFYLAAVEHVFLNSIYDYNNNLKDDFNYKTEFVNIFLFMQVTLLLLSLKFKDKKDSWISFLYHITILITFLYVFFRSTKEYEKANLDENFLDSFSKYYNFVSENIFLISVFYILIGYVIVFIFRAGISLLIKFDKKEYELEKIKHYEKIKSGKNSVLKPYSNPFPIPNRRSDLFLPIVSFIFNISIISLCIYVIFGNNVYIEKAEINGHIVKYQDNINTAKGNSQVIENFIEYSLGDFKHNDLNENTYLFKLAVNESKEKEFIHAFSNVQLNNFEKKVQYQEEISNGTTVNEKGKREQFMNIAFTKSTDYKNSKLFYSMIINQKYQEAVDFIQEIKHGLNKKDPDSNTITGLIPEIESMMIFLNESKLAKVDLVLWGIEDSIAIYHDYIPEIDEHSEITNDDLERFLELFYY